MYRDIERRLAVLEAHRQVETPLTDPLATRYIDYRLLLDPKRKQTGPIIIAWRDMLAPEGPASADEVG